MKQPLFLALCALALLGLLGTTVYKYEHRPQTAAQVTVAQALASEKAAQQTLKEHDAVNTAALANATTVTTTLTNQKAVLCAQIKAARLAQPLCY